MFFQNSKLLMECDACQPVLFCAFFTKKKENYNQVGDWG